MQVSRGSASHFKKSYWAFDRTFQSPIQQVYRGHRHICSCVTNAKAILTLYQGESAWLVNNPQWIPNREMGRSSGSACLTALIGWYTIWSMKYQLHLNGRCKAVMQGSGRFENIDNTQEQMLMTHVDPINAS